MNADFERRLAALRQRIARACATVGRDPSTVDLLAVSKTFPVEAIVDARDAGLRRFGENRVQELAVKAADPRLSGLGWQMIGSLQTNKVDLLLDCPGLELVHSVDRRKLVERLAAGLEARGRSLDVLVQVNATGEEQKHGVAPDDALELAHSVFATRNLRLRGLMAMGPLDGDPAPVFASVARLRAALEDALGRRLDVLSLGMSHDLDLAIAAGSTLVRVGSALFGERS